MTTLLSDYCFEINTCGIKKKGQKLSNINYLGGPAFAQDAFYEDYDEDLRVS